MVYYVYLYKDPRTLEPFYIGKGKGKRAQKHLWMAQRTIDGCPSYYDESPKLKRIIQILECNLEPIIDIIFETNSENEAFREEEKMINHYGRYPEGPLLNRTSGGEGTSGYKHTKQARLKMSKDRKGKAVTKHSEEWKQKLREDNPGGKATRKATLKLDLNYNLIKRYISRVEAMKDNNIKKSTFSNICKSSGKSYNGFYYRYE